MQQSLSTNALRPQPSSRSGSRSGKSKQNAKLREHMWNDPYSPFFKDLSCEKVINKPTRGALSSGRGSTKLSQSLGASHVPAPAPEDLDAIEEQKMQLTSSYLPQVSPSQRTLDSKRLFVAPELMAQALRNADDKFRKEKNEALNKLTGECNSAIDEKIREIHVVFEDQMRVKEAEMQAEIQKNQLMMEAEKNEALRQRSEDLRGEKEQALAALTAKKDADAEKALGELRATLQSEQECATQKLMADTETVTLSRIAEAESSLTAKLNSENDATNKELKAGMEKTMIETAENVNRQNDADKLLLVEETTLTTMKEHQLDVDTIRLNEAQKVTLEVTRVMAENQELVLRHVREGHDKALDEKEAEFTALDDAHQVAAESLEASVQRGVQLDALVKKLETSLADETAELTGALNAEKAKLAALQKEYDELELHGEAKANRIKELEKHLEDEKGSHAKTRAEKAQLERELLALKRNFEEEVNAHKLSDKVFADRIAAMEVQKVAMQQDVATKEKTISRLQKRMEALEKISQEGEKQQQAFLQQIQENSSVLQSSMALPAPSDSEHDDKLHGISATSESEVTESDSGKARGKAAAGEKPGSSYTVTLAAGSTGLEFKRSPDGRMLVAAAFGQAASSGVHPGDELLAIAGMVVGKEMRLEDVAQNVENGQRPLGLKMMHFE